MTTFTRRELMRRATYLAQMAELDLGAALEAMSVDQDKGLTQIMNQLYDKLISARTTIVGLKHDSANNMKVIDAMNASLMQAENDLTNAKNRENILNQMIEDLRAELNQALNARGKKLYIRYRKGNASTKIVGVEFELFRAGSSETGWVRKDNGAYWATEIDGEIQTFNEDPSEYGDIYFR